MGPTLTSWDANGSHLTQSGLDKLNLGMLLLLEFAQIPWFNGIEVVSILMSGCYSSKGPGFNF